MRRNVYELFCRRARGIPESASRSNFREFTAIILKHAAIQHNIIYQKTVLHFLFLGLMAAALVVAGSAEWSPYELIPGWTYHLEASRGQAWPGCRYRFLSYPNDCSKVDLWQGAGGNQLFTFEKVPGKRGTFYLKTRCGTYVSYSSDCNSTGLRAAATRGRLQEFKFHGSDKVSFEWGIEAVGRGPSCSARRLSFASTCSTGGPERVVLADGTNDSTFHVHATEEHPMQVHHVTSPGICADPAIYQSHEDGTYRLGCTGMKQQRSTDELSPSMTFQPSGNALNFRVEGGLPKWATSRDFWAPGHFTFDAVGGNEINVAFFSARQDSGRHRIGWAMSNTTESNSWGVFAETPLDLGQAQGGDIDPSVFRDDDGKTYLLWKTDDNSVGAKTTRLWIQQVDLGFGRVDLLGWPRMIMDSSGLWWVDSWVGRGSLIEGPELLKRGRFYYLFFAAGKFCQESYSEGVARSTDIFGPYAKLPVPLLSTNLVGESADTKLVGPGHASFVARPEDTYYAVYHASVGENCRRFPFVDRMIFNRDGWPYIVFPGELKAEECTEGCEQEFNYCANWGDNTYATCRAELDTGKHNRLNQKAGCIAGCTDTAVMAVLNSKITAPDP